MYLVDAISRPGSIPLIEQQPNQITDYAGRFGRDLHQIVGWCSTCDEKDKVGKMGALRLFKRIAPLKDYTHRL
jgi:hypothetical protein